MRAGVVLVAVGVLCAAGCTGGPTPAVPTSTGPTPTGATATGPGPTGSAGIPSTADTLSCGASIGNVESPSGDLAVVLDAVALPTRSTLQAERSGQPPLRFFAKQGLLVRLGKAFDLVVPPGWTDRVRIGWDRTQGTVVHVPACARPPGHPPWLAFPGGYWTTTPACIPLLVRSAGHEVTVHIGIGDPCPADH